MAATVSEPAASGLMQPLRPGRKPKIKPDRPARKPTTIELVGGIICIICNSILGKKKDFDSHYLKHNAATKKVRYTCVVCQFSNTNYPSFRDHCYTRHVIRDRYKCDNCKQTFSKLSAVKDHVETMHNFKCNKPGCDKRFPTKKDLHVHQILHKGDTNKPPYQCKSCGEEFENIPSCEDHIDKHYTVTYSCPLCDDNLNKENAYKHLMNHFGVVIADIPSGTDIEETPEDSSINIVGGILCCYCQKNFKNRIEIDAHFAEEHSDKDVLYTCVICQKQYEKYLLYGGHCYSHYTKHRFVCNVCDKKYPRLSLLVAHAEVHRADIQPDHDTQKDPEVRCRLCKLLLPDALAAHRHLSAHRRNRYTCPVCAREYAEKYLLMNHVPQHFEVVFHMCKVCGKTFAGKYRLVEHVKTHSKKYECKYCSKRFSNADQLSQHVNTHTGARPYACVACPKAFAAYPNLKKHVQRMHDIDPKTLKNTQWKFEIEPKADEKSGSETEPLKAKESLETWHFCDNVIEPVISAVEREATAYESELKSMDTSDYSITELTPVLPSVGNIVSVTEMEGETPLKKRPPWSPP